MIYRDGVQIDYFIVPRFCLSSTVITEWEVSEHCVVQHNVKDKQTNYLNSE